MKINNLFLFVLNDHMPPKFIQMSCQLSTAYCQLKKHLRELPCGRDRRASESQIEQRQLLNILPPALIPDIFFDDPLISSTTHRRYIVPIRPKLPSPQPLLYPRYPTENLLRRNTFDQPNHLTPGILWQKSAQQMHMILVKPYRLNL
jgi:hypothetical protein